jgi:hypothetical protein
VTGAVKAKTVNLKETTGKRKKLVIPKEFDLVRKKLLLRSWRDK